MAIDAKILLFPEIYAQKIKEMPLVPMTENELVQFGIN